MYSPTINREVLMKYASEMLKSKCTSIEDLSSSESYMPDYKTLRLTFEDGRSCLARFSLNFDLLICVSEAATLMYLNDDTSIPAPFVYSIQLGQDVAGVGSPYTLIEELPGQPLSTLWPQLTMKHKMSAVTQMAWVVAQLEQVKSRVIGSPFWFRGRKEGKKITGLASAVHPIYHDFSPNVKFSEKDLLNKSETAESYFVNLFSTAVKNFERYSHFLQSYASNKQEQEDFLPIFTKKLKTFLDGNLSFEKPFGLLHPNLDAKNVLFTFNPEIINKPPLLLTGVINFEFTRTSPTYFILSFPPFLLDSNSEVKEDPASKAQLRSQFVRHLLRTRPDINVIRSAFAKSAFIDDGNKLLESWGGTDPTELDGFRDRFATFARNVKNETGAGEKKTTEYENFDFDELLKEIKEEDNDMHEYVDVAESYEEEGNSEHGYEEIDGIDFLEINDIGELAEDEFVVINRIKAAENSVPSSLRQAAWEGYRRVC